MNIYIFCGFPAEWSSPQREWGRRQHTRCQGLGYTQGRWCCHEDWMHSWFRLLVKCLRALKSIRANINIRMIKKRLFESGERLHQPSRWVGVAVGSWWSLLEATVPSLITYKRMWNRWLQRFQQQHQHQCCWHHDQHLITAELSMAEWWSQLDVWHQRWLRQQTDRNRWSRWQGD